MGSVITLGVERMEVDWGKNHSVNNYSDLFQSNDECEIPYYYAEGIVEMKPGMSRKLSAVASRLDLLGFSEAALPEKFAQTIEAMPEIVEDFTITYEQFSHILRSIDLSKAFREFGEDDFDLGEYVSRFLFKDPEVVKHLPKDLVVNTQTGAIFENFEPFLILRILAMNPANADRLVQWRFTDVVEGGWIDYEDLIKPLSSESKILIVTEGSSDSSVIKRALNVLYPDIADFFDFVDMEANYPFTGTGNLFRFCQGLARINIQNKVLFLFDNDAAGIEKYKEAIQLKKPRSMHVCRLPDHHDFSAVMTVGPNGRIPSDINGSAVAIECFLDWKNATNAPITVRWTSYNKSLDRYQGEIERKEALVAEFHRSNLTNGTYDVSKLRFLIDYLLNEWISRPTQEVF